MGREMFPFSFPLPSMRDAMNLSTFKRVYNGYKNNKIAGLIVLMHLICVIPAQVVVREFSTVACGNAQFEKYAPLLKGKRVGVVTNASGLVGKTSIVDTLLSLKVNVKRIFGPEHGFRGDAEAGDSVQSHLDKKTGLPVVSLYGKNRKPTPEQLKDLDVLVYDIQDVGVRFYTYIATMCYVMEACAENNKECMVLDRPNPNGFYIDGPLLKPELRSFLGLHAVPIVYGMTCGEYAKMANGEGWLKNKAKCRLTVVTLKNYDRKASYKLPVKPSPNIPNEMAVLLYPGLGLFEGSVVSLGRGTPFPFQVIGHPLYKDTTFSFTPLASALSATPKYRNEKCYGTDLRKSPYLTKHPKRIELSWLINMYKALARPDFFDANFNYHAGNTTLQEQIKKGLNEDEIRASWVEELKHFKQIRKKYLLYPDFEQAPDTRHSR